MGTIQAIIYFEHAISEQGVRMISFSYHRSVLFPKKFELVPRILFLHFQCRLYVTGKPPMLWRHFRVICFLLHWSITYCTVHHVGEHLVIAEVLYTVVLVLYILRRFRDNLLLFIFFILKNLILGL